MKNQNVIMTVVICAYITAVPFHHAQAPRESGEAAQQVGALADQLIQALLKRDIAFYDKCYADDAVIVHGTGTQFSKAQEIANLRAGTLRYDGYDVSRRELHSYRGTVVETSQTSASGLYEGRPFHAVFRITRVWIRQKRGWQVVLFQGTRISANQ